MYVVFSLDTNHAVISAYSYLLIDWKKFTPLPVQVNCHSIGNQTHGLKLLDLWTGSGYLYDAISGRSLGTVR